MSLEPRLDPDEIDYLQGFMSCQAPGTTMVEWGSGGSTAFFVPYFKQGRFVSIEHNQEWFGKVCAEFSSGDYDPECLKNFTYAFIPPKVDIGFYGYGVPFEENPCFARHYISPQIDGVDVFGSDIFFVDGICRGAILATIAAKANRVRHYDATDERWRDTATVFIHDYFGPEQREPWYDWASSLFKRVERVGNTLARLHL